MKVLVTGGTGFIGSHTVVELLRSGYDVTAFDNLENSEAEVADAIRKISGKDFHFVKVDLRDADALEAALNQHPGISAVIHFAAYKAVGESVQFPLKYYENNIGGTINLLAAMMKRSIYDLVFSSSCTVYGDVSAEKLPITESSPTVKANSPYGSTKKICEEMLEDISSGGKLKTVSLRYFNPIGAHDSALIGELPIGTPTNLVPLITQTAIGKRKELIVYGNDYPTPDGTNVRDYIHVVDLGTAHVRALEYLKKMNAGSYEVFNIGTGKGNSVLEAIKAFEKVSGVKLNYRIGERRPGDVVQIYASCERAQTVLGWIAERDMENAMLCAWNWEQELAKHTSENKN